MALSSLAALCLQELEEVGSRNQCKRQEWRRGREKGRVLGLSHVESLQVPKDPTFTPIKGHCQSTPGCQGGFAPIPSSSRDPASFPDYAARGSQEQREETMGGRELRCGP